mgnify:CR=1 FL=1
MRFIRKNDVEWKKRGNVQQVKMLLEKIRTPECKATFGLSKWPSGQGGKLHEHLNLDEVFYVTKGRGLVKIVNNVIELNEGDLVYISAGEKHAVIKSYPPYGIEMLFVLIPSCSETEIFEA